MRMPELEPLIALTILIAQLFIYRVVGFSK
jgi:hypothetical protein